MSEEEVQAEEAEDIEASDEELWEQENILCHPLTNTATLSLKKEDLERYIQKTGHQFQLVEVPHQLAE